MSEGNIWLSVLNELRGQIDSEEFRRWFSTTSYASDSGDQVTVWAPTDADCRHLTQTYAERLERILRGVGRPHTTVRFVATGYSEDEEDEE